MKLRVSGSVVMAALGLMTTMACSGGRRDDIFDSEASSSSGGASSSGELSSSSSGGIGASGGASSSSSGSSGDFAQCASSSVLADLSPVYLTIVLDKSGSMCFVGSNESTTCSNNDSRWRQVQAALNTFFQSAESAGVFVSVIPFSGDDPVACNPTSYAAVPTGYPHRLALPVNGTTNFGGTPVGGTPTAPSLRGALDFTRAELASTELAPNAKVAMLFVTDGVPDGCTDNDGNRISRAGGTSAAERQPSLDAANAAVTAGVPLYVLGIGGATEFEVLDHIAQTAGTNGGVAFKIDASNPGGVSGSMLAALASIRGAELSCELQIPPPPENEALDYTKINVVHTPLGGTETVIPRSDDCAEPSGWHYDDPSAPRTIQLCEGACATAKSGGTLEIVLGCATRGPS